MLILQRKKLPSLLLGAWIFLFASQTWTAQESHSAPAAGSEVIACRVLEAHTSRRPETTVAVFHQKDDKDRARLGGFLRKQPEMSVEFQTADGAWHPATVFRLKSCFGRGLLVFPAGSAQLEEKGEFLLRFSSH
jgi:hypothetical protein